MPIEHLSEFIDELAERGELIRVEADVSSQHELVAVALRAAAEPGSPALLFDSVDGQSIPVVCGLFNTPERTCRALGADTFSETADRISAVVQPELPSDWMEALRLVPRLTEVSRWPVNPVETAVVQQVVHMGSDVDLTRLPVPVCSGNESRPLLTASQVYVEESVGDEQSSSGEGTALRLVSRVPVQIVDRNTVLVYWTPHDGEWQVVKRAAAAGRQLHVAVALGGDPVLTFAAGAPLPRFVDPLVFAGFLRKRNVDVITGRSVDIHVPANAEIVLEGVVDPERAFDSAEAITTPTGYYDHPETAVRLTVTALTHRANPVLPVIVPNAPPGEDGWLSQAAERIFLPLVRLAIPELVDLRLPLAGGHRNIAFASIRKTWPQQARKVMNALWGIDRLCCVKLLIVVDEHVNIHDDDAVWQAVGTSAHPGRDTIFSEGPADMLDHAAPVRGVGHRMGIDATAKSADEGHLRPWPDRTEVDEKTLQLVRKRWHVYGITNRKTD